MKVVSVDLGGTKLAAALIEQRVILQRLEVPTASQLGPEGVNDQIANLIRSLVPAGETVQVAVAATERVQHGRVTALNSLTMPGWTDIDLPLALQRRTGLRATVLNDADAAALGEAKLGAGLGSDAVMFVTVSSGIGVGVVLNGELLRSISGLQADLGYLRLSGGATVEELAGGRALERWVHEHGGTGGAAQLIRWAAERPAAADRLALAVRTLVWAFGQARVLTGIDDVVVGGSVGLNPVFFQALKIGAEAEPDLYRVRLHTARLGADAGLYGAALFAGR
jgi:N-acylmannosamine kinase